MPDSEQSPLMHRAAHAAGDGAAAPGRLSDEIPLTRRALREARDAASASSQTPPIFKASLPPLPPVAARPAPLLPGRRRRAPIRHARMSHAVQASVSAALTVASLIVVGSASAVTVALAPAPVAIVADEAVADTLGEVRIQALPGLGALPLTAEAFAPDETSVIVRDVPDPCGEPAVLAAIAAGDETAAITAAGGATVFRDAVASGLAPCIRLDDPARTWLVVDKARPFVPIDYAPESLAVPAGMRDLGGGELRAEAAEAMTHMAAASIAGGAGEIGVASAYRSYATQIATYEHHARVRGGDQADLVSARPGYSEHQSGLAADVVPCAETCGTIDDLASTTQGEWIAANAWQYGWVVRYEEGGTDVTGYLSEPWHLRYIGVELAREYHEGGWRTLEEFFGLPPAPHYDHQH
ncbi:D-alanyl-D-alanine carboxypeptidase family protein [Microbacterium sp. NPDC055357]